MRDGEKMDEAAVAALLLALESTIVEGVDLAVDEYLDLARDAVIPASGEPDPSKLPDAGVWLALLMQVVKPLLSKVFSNMFGAQADAKIGPYLSSFEQSLDSRLAFTRFPDAVAKALAAELEHARVSGATADGSTIGAQRILAGVVLAGAQWGSWARRLADTELLTAFNAGTLAGAQASGQPFMKRWSTILDTHERSSHHAANAQTVPGDQPFTVGGSLMSYPGDPSAPADEVVNCRCHLIILPIPLTASGGPAMKTPSEWSGLLAPLNKPSSDGRMIGDLNPDSFADRPLPVPLLYQDELAPGHDGAFQVGTITDAWQDENGLMACGTFNLDDPRAAAVADKVASGNAGWTSVTVGNADMSAECLEMAEDGECAKMAEKADNYELISATLVNEPAFGTARITAGALAKPPKPSDDAQDSDGKGEDGEPHASGETVDYAGYDGYEFTVLGASSLPVADPDTAWSSGEAISRIKEYAKDKDGIDGGKYGKAFLWRDGDPDKQGSYKLPYADVIGGELKIVPRAVMAIGGVLRGARGGVDVPSSALPALRGAAGRLYSKIGATAPWDAKKGKEAAALTAGGAPIAPPAGWFGDPQLTGPTPLQITEDGRVFGHLALFGTCHISFPGKCITPPKSKSGYAFFHSGSVLVAEGELLPVGKIVTSTPHAALTDSYAAAQQHYDNSGCTVAIVRAGEDAHGIWVAGALVIEASAAQVAELRRSPLSGDWRSIGGRPEMVAALAVNTPGFAVAPRGRSNARADMFSLVAAGVVPVDAGQTPCSQVAELANQVADIVVAKLDSRLPGRKPGEAAQLSSKAFLQVRKQTTARAMEKIAAAAKKGV